MVSESKPNRRWFRFSLRSLFALVTLVAVAMGYVGWQVRIVEHRRLMVREIRDRGGQVWTGLWGWRPESAFQISWLRQQLGDVPVNYVAVPDAEKRVMKEVFPEALILASEEMARLGNPEH